MNDHEARLSRLRPIRTELAKIIETLSESSHLHARLPQARVSIANEHLKLAIQELDSVLEGVNEKEN